MNTTKKNGFLKAAGLMMSVTMLASCVVAGTMAKYTSKSGDINLEATVASWKITANSDDISELVSLSEAFKIYDTAESGSTYTNIDDNIKEPTLIAPGTWGYASVEIENEGEVDAEISAAFVKSGTTLPEGMTVVPLSTVPTSPDQVTGSSTLSPVTIKPSNSTNVVIAFKWEFGDGVNDDNDTPFGTNAASGTTKELDLGTLTITADQVD